MIESEQEATMLYLKKSSNSLIKDALAVIDVLKKENEELKKKPTSVKEIRLQIEELVKHVEGNGGNVTVGQNILGETVVSITKKIDV